MMTIVPARDNSNDRGDDVKGDVINNDVIVTIPTSLMIVCDNDNDFMIALTMIIRTRVLMEIIEHCAIHTSFRYVIALLTSSQCKNSFELLTSKGG